MKSTMFTCRCCASSVCGWVDGHVAAHGWHYIDGIDGPNMICPACYDEPDPLESLRADGYDARIGLPCPVRDAPPAVVTIPAAELARLRTSARALLDALNEHEDASEEADRIDYHEDHAESVYGAKAALHAALHAALAATSDP